MHIQVMDGLTCVRKIREWQKDGTLTRPVPVIAVTANARPEQIQTAKEAGMVCWGVADIDADGSTNERCTAGRRRHEAVSHFGADSANVQSGAADICMSCKCFIRR